MTQHQRVGNHGSAAPIRGEFPIFETTTYLNSCSQGALSHRVRARRRGVARRLGRERRRVGLLGRAERDVPLGDRWASPRTRPTTSPSRPRCPRASARSSPRCALDERAEPHRRSRSTSSRPSARSRTRRSSAAPRSSTSRPSADGSIPRGALRGGDRRADGARLLHDALVPLRATATTSRPSPRRRTPPARSSSPTATRPAARSSSTSASLGADVVTGGTVKYLLGTAGLGFMWVRPEVHETLVPTQTGWFADEDIFAMSIADYSPHASARRFDSGTPPVPSLYAGRRGHLARRGDGRRRDRGARARGSTTVCSTGSTSSARPSRRLGRPRAGPTRVRPLDGRRGTGRSARGRADRRLVARGQASDRAPPLQRRGGRRHAPRRARAEPLVARLTRVRPPASPRRRRASPTATHPVPPREPPPPRPRGRPVAVRRARPRRVLAKRLGSDADDPARRSTWRATGSRPGTSSTGAWGRTAAVGRGRSRTSPPRSTISRRSSRSTPPGSRRAATLPADISRSGSPHVIGCPTGVGASPRVRPVAAVCAGRRLRSRAGVARRPRRRRGGGAARPARGRLRAATPRRPLRRSPHSASRSCSCTAPRTTPSSSRRAGIMRRGNPRRSWSSSMALTTST